jgi:hypothetical protein
MKQKKFSKGMKFLYEKKFTGMKNILGYEIVFEGMKNTLARYEIFV